VGTCPRAEDFEDQTGAVNDLRLPTPFEITLLHRAQHAVDDNQTELVFADQLGEVFKGPAPEEATRPRSGDPGDLGTDYIEIDCPGETDRFLKPSLDRTARYFRWLLAGR
jgi:hypothetical protein